MQVRLYDKITDYDYTYSALVDEVLKEYYSNEATGSTYYYVPLFGRIT